VNLRKVMTIDPALPTPVYAQIEEQMARVIASGAFEPGEQIPSVRELAVTLRVNPLTVSKAYSRLADRGLVVAVRGKGVFVAEERPRLPLRERERLVDAKIKELVQVAGQLDVPAERILKLVERALPREKSRGRHA
jgi:GntR family transcriptional regulator